jgi:hypothetical protein
LNRGVTLSRPRRSNSLYQNCWANTQVEMMRWTDSSSWSHSTHLSWMREASLCWSICYPAFNSNGKP